MARLDPQKSVLKRLFALSGNACAFPECTTVLFDNRGLNQSEVAHIEAANKGGPRFNPAQTDDQRRAFENLMLLCPTHHNEIDSTATSGEYPVPRLQRMKSDHEGAWVSNELCEALQSGSDLPSQLVGQVTSLFQSGGQTAGIIVNLDVGQGASKQETLSEDSRDLLRFIAVEAARSGTRGVLWCLDDNVNLPSYRICKLPEFSPLNRHHHDRMENSIKELVEGGYAQGHDKGGLGTAYFAVILKTKGQQLGLDLGAGGTAWWERPPAEQQP